jgi:hypothetical protein
LIETHVWFGVGQIPLALAIELTPDVLGRTWRRSTNWRAMFRILLQTRFPLARQVMVSAIERAIAMEPRGSDPKLLQQSLALLRSSAADLANGSPIQRPSEILAARSAANSQASYDVRFRKGTNSGYVWDALYHALGSVLERVPNSLFGPRHEADQAIEATIRTGVAGDIVRWLWSVPPPTLDELVAASIQESSGYL